MDDNGQRKASLNQPLSWPLWVRIAVMAGIAGWFALELYHGDSMWAVISFAMLCYGAWTLFLDRPKTPDHPPQ